MKMTSSKPYLIRALYEWIVDNELTPYLVVNAKDDDVSVPQQYVNKDGQIVLNIAPRAVVSLQMEGECVAFNARFGGVPTDIYVPCYAVLGIYARENGQGMMFEPEAPTPPPEPTKPKVTKAASDKPSAKNLVGGDRSKPSLRVVK